MRVTRTKTATDQRPIGVIEALATGFEIVRHRPWIPLFPIVLDLILWIAPRLSLTSLLLPALALLESPKNLSPDSMLALEEWRQALTAFASSVSIFGMVNAALNQITQFPSLLGIDTELPASPVSTLAFSINVNTAWLTVVLFVPLFFLGLFASAIYLDAIADGVRPLEKQSITDKFRSVSVLWLRLIIYTAFIVGLLVLFTPIFILVLQVNGLSPDLGAFLSALALVILIWVLVYLYFAADAVAVARVGVLEAMRHSVLMFRINFWQTMLLILISFVINQGWSLLWHGLEASNIGVAFAITANAFMGSALIAAAMVFYLDRLNWFMRLREKFADGKKT